MILRADARAIPLRDGCVDCVVTSVPYWNMRDYGHPAQIGRECSLDAYLTEMRVVFTEVWRVLKDTGTLWCNVGDSHAGSGRGGDTGASGLDGSTTHQDESKRASGPRIGHRSSFRRDRAPRMDIPHKTSPRLKAKDLVGAPWALAFALRDAGWYLRADIVWAKGVSFCPSYVGSVMPEAVRDRPTISHEYLFLLAKSRRYYFDAAAIAEPVSVAMVTEVGQGYNGVGLKEYAAVGVQNPSTVKARIIDGARLRARANGRALTRNVRSVWTISSEAYTGGDHFAVMPEAMVTPCVLAGCPPGGVVLDPFGGTGTVAMVAERVGRRWVSCDLGYHDLARARTTQRGLRWDKVTA